VTVWLPPRRYVTIEEVEAEEAELRTLQDRLTSVTAQIARITAERYDPLWSENVRLARRIRYWEDRVAGLEIRLTELRSKGWAYLKKGEREEYLLIRDHLLPDARRRLEDFHTAQEIVIADLWKITEELSPLRAEVTALKSEIRKIQRELKRKIVYGLQRVELNAYIIIERGEKTYHVKRKSMKTARKHGYYVKVTRKYPKGRFQAWFQIDCWVLPETGAILEELDPTSMLIRDYVMPEIIDEIDDKFHIRFTREDFTIGETSKILGDEDLGKPPKKIRVERTIEQKKLALDEYPKKDYPYLEERFVLTQEEYNALVSDYPDYVNELKRRGVWKE